MSSGAAAALMGEALALRHRLPRIWAAVLAGDAVPWRARKIAHACLALSQQAAAIVDRRVVGIVDTVTPGALDKIVKAAVWEADPDAAKAQAEAAARTRGVFVAPSDDHGTKRIWVRAAVGDVIRFDASIDDLARALKTLGDPDDLNQRRAKALGWIADPTAAHHLLEVARHLARTQPTQEPPNTAASDGATSDGAAGADSAVCDSADSAGDAAWGDPEVLDCADFEQEPTPSDTAASRHDSGDDPGDTHHTGATHHTGDAEYPGDSDDAVRAVQGSANDVAVDAFSRRVLAGALPARLAAIKREAYREGLGLGGGRRNRHTLYVHLTDRTLATGNGVLRVEELGPLLAGQLNELLGHDQIVVKPVIDLQDQVSVHSYEIPDRIRERVRLQHPVDMFPYSGAEATVRMDQDHIAPYERAGPPRQTTTDNLIPLGRLHHRAKTFGGWQSRRLPTGAIAWTSPHGFRFVVDYTGTHQVPTAPLTQHAE
ncbi:DUF222 domain-containing protein [Kribbella speibonae]|uniref:DUF222 domain-containing protein n=2 Tax=Kribbella speibonae TaxID=1572660 RepID=A0A4R0J8U6_9ACTN|nr:DUF222 domain-containing protein [Kribbella speibonae]